MNQINQIVTSGKYYLFVIYSQLNFNYFFITLIKQLDVKEEILSNLNTNNLQQSNEDNAFSDCFNQNLFLYETHENQKPLNNHATDPLYFECQTEAIEMIRQNCQNYYEINIPFNTTMQSSSDYSINKAAPLDGSINHNNLFQTDQDNQTANNYSTNLTMNSHQNNYQNSLSSTFANNQSNVRLRNQENSNNAFANNSNQMNSINQLNNQITDEIVNKVKDAIFFNDKTQEYILNDCPIEIVPQNIAIINGQKFYKVIREDLIPIYNQNDHLFLTLSSNDTMISAKENQPSIQPQSLKASTLKLMKKTSVNHLLLKQDNLPGQLISNDTNFELKISDLDCLNNNSLNQANFNQHHQNSLKRLKTSNNIYGNPDNYEDIGQDNIYTFDNKFLHPLIANLLVNYDNLNSIDKTVKKLNLADSNNKINSSSTKKRSNKNPKQKKTPNHPCPFCPKLFQSNGSLVVHNRQHTGEKPFECEHCAAKYARKSSLSRHKK